MDAGMGILLTIGLIVIGVAGFIVMAIALSFRFFGWSFRKLLGRDRSREVVIKMHSDRRVTCPYRECGHDNEPTALFCARCGRKMRG